MERVADRIAVLDDSVLRACCTLEMFRNNVRQVTLQFAGDPPSEWDVPGLLHTTRIGSEVRLTLVNVDGQADAALQEVGAAAIEEVPLGLEEAFTAYLGERGERRSFFDNLRSPA